MKRVIIESPYAGETENNLAYLRACMADCLAVGEAPFASRALYTQPGVLDDSKPHERRLGIDAGFAWWESADVIVFYVDLGWSGGMRAAWERCRAMGVRYAVRVLDGINDLDGEKRKGPPP